MGGEWGAFLFFVVSLFICLFVFLFCFGLFLCLRSILVCHWNLHHIMGLYFLNHSTHTHRHPKGKMPYVILDRRASSERKMGFSSRTGNKCSIFLDLVPFDILNYYMCDLQ